MKQRRSFEERGNTLVFLLVVLAFALLAVGAYSILRDRTIEFLPAPEQSATTTPNIPLVPTPYQGIVVTTPLANGTTTMPIAIKGSVQGSDWAGFEGQTGSVVLLDSADKQLAGPVPLTATTDWMQPDVDFSATIGDSKLAKTLIGKTVTLRFRSESPRGEEFQKTFDLLVVVVQ